MNKPYSKMISNDFKRSIIESEVEIINHFRTNRKIALYGFETELAANEFAKLFPKYVKVKPMTSQSWKKDINEYEEWGVKATLVDGKYTSYGVEFKIDRITEVTGEANETGEKRLNKFLQILKTHGYIE